MTHQTTMSTCTCGQVALEVQGRPIISAECLCADCQNAGAFLQSLPAAPRTLDQKGATRFVLYRKDRVRCEKRQDLLREHRLSKDSTIVRVVVRAQTRRTIVFATRLQSRAIESFDLLAILGRERQVKMRGHPAASLTGAPLERVVMRHVAA